MSRKKRDPVSEVLNAPALGPADFVGGFIFVVALLLFLWVIFRSLLT